MLLCCNKYAVYGEDNYMNLEKEKLLIISPHADDEVMGCFGLINRIKKGGGKVFVQVLSLGGFQKFEGIRITKEDWKKEVLKVSKFLNIDDYQIAHYEDEIIHIDIMPQQELIELLEFRSKIAISKIKPTIVAIPTIFSTHQDHTQAYRVSIAALRPHSQKTSYLPHLVISYESPEYYFWSAATEFGKFSPNFYIHLTKNDIDKKIKAMNIYKTQTREDQRDGSSLDALARIRGHEIGLDYAEAYHIHRFFL